MKRGRKGDSPKVKKGKAGKFRKPDSRKRAKQPKMSVEERAALIAALPAGEIPAFMLEGSDFDPALVIWRDLAADLRRLNALQRPDRYAFAMYCVHMANWIEAEINIKKDGAIYHSRNTVNGDQLQKLSPWVRVREISERHILEIGARFGLDPLNRFKLINQEALGGGQGRLPFGDDVPAATQSGAEDSAPTAFLARNGSQPRPN